LPPGWVLFALAAIFIGYDVTHQLKWLWGYILRFKFAVLATNFLIRGSAGWLEHRRES
jgi:hypothetical protein